MKIDFMESKTTYPNGIVLLIDDFGFWEVIKKSNLRFLSLHLFGCISQQLAARLILSAYKSIKLHSFPTKCANRFIRWIYVVTLQVYGTDAQLKLKHFGLLAFVRIWFMRLLNLTGVGRRIFTLITICIHTSFKIIMIRTAHSQIVRTQQLLLLSHSLSNYDS